MESEGTYTKTYGRTRRIHQKPMGDLVEAGARIMHHYRQNGGVEVRLTPLENGVEIADPVELHRCHFCIRSFSKSTHMQIVVKGRLPQQELEEIADNVGHILSEDYDLQIPI